MLKEKNAKRILIVDDDEITLQLLEHILSKAGYEVLKANGGEEALELITGGNIPMIISDWEMPDCSGLELCNRVRENDASGYTYFILLTHRNRSEDLVKGMNNGADDFITKPFNPDEVMVRVRAGERILTLESRDVAIFALAKLAESRDPETGAHLERMQAYTRTIADRLLKKGRHPEVNRGYVRNIHLTAPLHDIGKVGIPDAVLLKPGRLTDFEFNLMKDHTRIGASTLKSALSQFPDAEYLKMAHDIALTHHERFDGSGYPQGLKGERIPLAGRITALADVYDAVSSVRVYKEAFSHSVSRDIILKGEGAHFDPAVVQAFLECEEIFMEIKARFSEIQV